MVLHDVSVACHNHDGIPPDHYCLQFPLVKLDDSHYKLVDAMESLIPQGNEPSLKQSESLTVKGPVAFSKGVVIKGAATVSAPGPEACTLEQGEYSGEVVLQPAKVAVPA